MPPKQANVTDDDFPPVNPRSSVITTMRVTYATDSGHGTIMLSADTSLEGYVIINDQAWLDDNALSIALSVSNYPSALYGNVFGINLSLLTFDRLVDYFEHMIKMGFLRVFRRPVARSQSAVSSGLGGTGSSSSSSSSTSSKPGKK